MPRRYISRMNDFSGGAIGGVSDFGSRPKHLRVAENVDLRPYRAVQVRLGTQRMTTATLTTVPHSLLEWVSDSGTSIKYVGSAATPGALNAIGGGALTAQTCAYPLQANSRMSSDQLDGALWLTEQSGSEGPLFYRSSNPANTFHRMLLPRPAFPALAAGVPVAGTGIPAATTLLASVVAGAVSLTLSANATATGTVTLTIGSFTIPNCQTTLGSATVTYQSPTLTAGAGGALTVSTTYYYRLRFRYRHGSSMAFTTPLSVVLGGAQNRVTVTTIPLEIRSDYLGWTLERTKAGGSSIGPFYLVADGTANNYTDDIADADLGARTDELLHGEPPHMDGIIGFKNRLFGWDGSTLYCSQAIADSEATGIANWPALQAYDFGKADGDDIATVVLQNERLVILKGASVWVLEGDDPDSFRVVPIYNGAGASGLRAATSMGSTVWFFGKAGLHRMQGDTIKPFGWVEVGDIVDGMSKSRYADVVLKNHLGQRFLFAFSSGGARNDDMLVYDQRFGGWTRWTGIYAQDILVPKVADFGDAAAFLYIDTRDRDSGAGTSYWPMIGNYGRKDDKVAAGTGGIAIPVAFETPIIDDGSPDVFKDYERLEVYAQGSSLTLNATLRVDPAGPGASLALSLPTIGTLWGAALWGSFKWGAASQELSAASGLPEGTYGRRYSIRFTASVEADFKFKGYALDAILQPERRYT